MRLPADAEISAPHLPRGLPWVNVKTLRMDQQKGRPVLVEFWDFCRVNSLRTLPYLKAWHERYADRGLRVVSVHTGGYPWSRDPELVRTAVERLGIEHPVLLDEELKVWDDYGVEGWPSRYLWGPDHTLFSFQHGEGGYQETEREIQDLLGIDEPLLPALRPEDEPGMLLPAQTEDQPGAFSGPYEAGAVWAVFDGHGEARVNGRAVAVDGPGCYLLAEHAEHTAGVLELDVGPGVKCLQTCFTPAVAPAGRDLARPAGA